MIVIWFSGPSYTGSTASTLAASSDTNLNLVESQNDYLTLKIKNDNLAGQYECQADNGIDEKQSIIISVNVAGRKTVDYFMNFAP